MSLSRALFLSIRACAWAGFVVMAWRLSVKDWRIQKIQHRELSLGAGLAAAAYALLLADTLLGVAGVTETYLRLNFYGDLFVHLVLTTAAALGLWRLRVWPAGDAKLYLLLGSVAPMLTAEPNFLGGRYFLAALINVFLPACVFVFVQVAHHVWHARLKHAAGFVIQAGARRAWGLATEGVRRSATDGREAAAKWLRGVRQDPLGALGRLAYMAAMFAAMAGFSAGAHAFLPSATLRSALSVAVLYFVMKGEKSVARWTVWGAAAATAIWSFVTPPGSDFRRELAAAAGSLTVFTFFLQFGAVWTMSLVGGNVPKAILPLASMAFGFVLMVLGTAAAQASRFTHLLGLALMGAFFGLCHVFVRIWEEDDKPQIPVEKLRAYMLPHRSFLALAEKEDPDFLEAHFSDVYADGMTPRQAMAARGWARRMGLETVPIQTTMSFAFWIFLGYFLTWALGGSVLEKIL